MNLQQAGQPKSSNGYGHRKSEREGATKSENKILSGKLNANRLANAGKLLSCIMYYYFICHIIQNADFFLLVFTGAVTGSKGGSYESPSHDRLVYVTTCLIGHQVEVQVKNGSIYSGIFHATNTDKDFGMFCCIFLN